MASVEEVSTPEQATEEFWVRVKRTAMQVAGGFTAVAGPLAIAELNSEDRITAQEGKGILIAGGVAAATLAIAAVMNYFKPVQTNP
jgi:hypothetical protein